MQKILINLAHSKGTINKNIYGHFAEHLGRCIYQGLYVGKDSQIPNVNGMRTDVVQALKHIKVPVLRWPGGCFADEYHWEDGIGPQEGRKRMVNTNWGGVVEDNSFGTHEFLELCEQIGCEPYINANVGSGTVREMAEWVEYLNSDGDSTVVRRRWANGRKEAWNVKFWGVGNESWGCGGNMRPEYYADEYRRYQTFCRQYGKNKLYKIACGPNSGDYKWTETVMRLAGKYMDALSLHYYTVPHNWEHKGSATVFGWEDYLITLHGAMHMEELISNHLAIMNRYDPEHKVGLIIDEWGGWYDVEPGTNPGFLYQQNTMRDAMIAAITLNIFNSHCDRVVMANLAQTVNVLQAVILTEGDKMVLTPTYHVFDLYKAHQDARGLDCVVEAEHVELPGRTDESGNVASLPMLTASASEKNGVITLTAANLNPDEPKDVEVTLFGEKLSRVTARILQGGINQYNDFDGSPLSVEEFTSFETKDGALVLHLPACCVVEVSIHE